MQQLRGPAALLLAVSPGFPMTEASPATSVASSLSGRTVGRFVIGERLGKGGMGEVYRAEDTRLKRTVALKRLSPYLRSDPLYRRRFQEEAERASRFADPHVAAIYDVLDEQEETLLVMEYVEGKTLRHRLHDPMSLDEFLKIAIECAQALVAADHVGIVHCDIKPENIMLSSSGTVKILDFGVAKFLPRSDQSSTVDRTGTIGGTPAYMSPEVLLEKGADGRSDIFSLGLVLYEALAGHHPFLSDSYVATTHRILHEKAAPIRVFNSGVSEELERIVAQAMAKDPEERYARAQDLLDDLRDVQTGVTPSKLLPARRKAPARRRRRALVWTLAAVTVLAGLVAGTASRWRRWLGLGQPPAAQMHLAILPFTPSSNDPNSRAFAQGLTETLAVRLTQLTSAYPLQIVSPREISAEEIRTAEQARKNFGVNLVLEGNLRESDNLVRVSYSLVDTSDLTQLRGDTVTVESSKPFDVEDRVLQSVVGLLGLELRPGEKSALLAHGTSQPAAYDYYLRGRGYLQEYHRPENLESAITVFNHALETDPNYALAYAGLGEAYLHEYDRKRESSWVDKALQSCKRAISLANGLANGHICLGMVDNSTGRYEEAVQEMQRAVQLDPTSDDALRGLASAYESLGKAQDAEQTYLRAIELRPQYWGGYAWLGGFYWRHSRYDDAARMYTEMIALAPDSFQGYNNLGGTYLYQGRYADAIPQFQRSVAIFPSVDAYSNLATALFLQGDFNDASHTYERALEVGGNDALAYLAWGNLAEAYYWTPGQQERATDAYRKAIALAKDRLQVNQRDAFAMYHLALYEAMLQQQKLALEYLQRALQLLDGDSELLFNAAKIHARLGQPDTAMTFLQKSVAVGYSVPFVRDDPMFKNLANNVQFHKLVGK
jgi:serine/threonine protein kinase/tetratricopeptide (TPR) repeat protein